MPSSTKAYLYLSLSTVAVLAAVVAWWLISESNHAPALAQAGAPAITEDEADAAVMAAALAQIDAESAGRDPTPRIEAPPNLDLSAFGQPSAAPALALPEGYSFTAFEGEMAKGRMTELDVEEAADPAAEHTWLLAGDGIDTLVEQAAAADRDWTFGWVGVAPGADPDALAERLGALGAAVLDRSGNLLRARLPGDASRLEAIARLDEVAGIAPTPTERKLPKSLVDAAQAQPSHERTPAFVTLMTDDPDGRWRQALTELGAVVGHFDPAVRVYAANVPFAALDAIVAADFVLAVEPVGRVRAAHDTAVPAMGADALRLYDDATGLFSGTGGASVPIGVMDTGLNINHPDISSNRRSICGGNFSLPPISDPREQDQDLWIDGHGHGTHVTGTIVGNGSAVPRFAGMAPLVQDIRFAKVLGSFGGGSAAAVWRGMDFLSRATACGPGAPVKPLLVNMSLGQNSGPEGWEGRSAAERKLDSVVWSRRQLYVVAQSNSGFNAYGNYAAAKNSLAVGAVQDGGDIVGFSSHGPTADGRLAPQVVGTGVSVVSAMGSGRHSGYRAASGTSMASPAVAGVAALLMDAVPELREQPAAVRARLMASAIRPDAFLEDAAQFPLHNGDGPGDLQHRYGLGKVSARTSVLSRDAEDGWVSGSVIVEVGDGEYGHHDIEVPEGTSRLDLVMTWDERSSDTLAQPVLNDLDLWVDRDADCGASQPAACGNAASRSTKDNVEWLILRNPPAGLYRLKVVPKRTRVETPRAALAWTVIRGPSTPQLAINVDTTAVVVEPGSPFEVNATLAVDGYVAAGTMLRIDCRAEEGSAACSRANMIAPRASGASREDGISRPLASGTGEVIALGEVAVGEEQTVKLVFKSLRAADRFRLYLTATAWNAASASTSVDVSVGKSDVASSPAAGRPANDDVANAERLVGDAGSREFDLLLATPDPGEPPFERRKIDNVGRFQQDVRPRSLWYTWTAPAADTYRFSIAGAGPDDLADDVQLDLFEARENTPLVSLKSISARVGGLVFGASRADAFRIRLSIGHSDLFEYPDNVPDRPEDILRGRFTPIARREVAPLSLHWSRAALPANDDFELATVLEGESGTVSGSNMGATLQAGEFFPLLAATTWHRWTAPASGDWRFKVDRRRLKVAVFTGSDMVDLRLVSGLPAGSVTFPVREGDDYLIAVAAEDVFVSGSDYALHWGPGKREKPGNDDIASAEEIPGLPSSIYQTAPNFDAATVAPGEPAETGSRTAWWSWVAPSDGTYTWRADTYWKPPVQLAIFAGSDAADLTLAAMSGNDRKTGIELSFAAVAGERYWIVAGLPADAALTPTPKGPVIFLWGLAPPNDAFAAAEVLAGAKGVVSGSNAFATVEADERTGTRGDASLWYTWEAPAAAWYHFLLSDGSRSGILAVYRMHGDGIHQLELVADSRRLTEAAADAIFQAEAGVRYVVRLGNGAGNAPGNFGIGVPGNFTLSWAERSPPAWLRYAGSIVDHDFDAGGKLLQIADPNSWAFNADGSELYAASRLGLQVYARDAESGALGFVQSLPDVDPAALLLWDSQTSALIAGSCAGWRKFAPADAGSGLEDAGPIAGEAPCPGDSVFLDSTGSSVNIVRADRWMIETYLLDEIRESLVRVGFAVIHGLQTAVIGGNDDFVYAGTSGSVGIYARDPDTGTLKFLDSVGRHGGISYENARLLTAADASGRYLLVLDEDGRYPMAFDLQDPAQPALLAKSAWAAPEYAEFWGQVLPPCRIAGIRTQTLSVDVFCPLLAFSAQLLPEDRTFQMEDLLVSYAEDIFGNQLPRLPLEGIVAASPDGKHIYAADNDRILIFERVGSL